MSNCSLNLDDALHGYLIDEALREHRAQPALRGTTRTHPRSSDAGFAGAAPVHGFAGDADHAVDRTHSRAKGRIDYALRAALGGGRMSPVVAQG